MPYDPKRHGPIRVVGPGFHERVFALLRKVPAGKVTTYGDLGAALGLRAAARQVGYALAALPSSSIETEPIPWHRVVNSRGEISFRGDGTRCLEQRRKLAAEGIDLDNKDRVIDFNRHRAQFAGGESNESTRDLDKLCIAELLDDPSPNP